MTMETKKMFRRILSMVLFVMGIAFFAAALFGHKPAYPPAACCFFAAMLSNIHEKER